MTSRSRGIIVRSLFVSALLLAVFAAAVIGGAVPVQDSARNLVGICMLVVAASDVLIAFFLLTRS